MKTAVIGSRGIEINDIGKYIPEDTSEIISGGAKGIDTCAKKYAIEKGIKLTEFLPEYDKYGKGAPIVRNVKIIERADRVIALWDGKSKGTKFVIETCKKQNKKVTVYML